MSATRWNPRGEPTWPEWKQARRGQRFEHVRSGARGTFLKVAKVSNNGARVRWDAVTLSRGLTLPEREAYVVAPAFDLRPVDDE